MIDAKTANTLAKTRAEELKAAELKKIEELIEGNAKIGLYDIYASDLLPDTILLIIQKGYRIKKTYFKTYKDIISWK